MPELIFSDKYEVQEQIAQGGMGIVYKAMDRKLGRVVALKVVHAHLCSDQTFLQRFLREARAMARLQHENIVTIHAVGQDRDTHFIDMEYVQGSNLQDSLTRRISLPLHEAITIAHQIASALAYAHKHGIIHRDVKPANVLMDSDGRIKLTDFGIAAALDEAPLTSAGQLIGTLLYMSPEQARDSTLDGRSDLYSLGLMLYEMITGTHPRRGLSNAAVLGMLSGEGKAPPLTFPSKVPAEVQSIVKDLLRYRPVDRMADAQQLVRRLESLPELGAMLPSSSGAADSTASDQTIFELGKSVIKPAKSKPEQPVKRPEETRRIVMMLLLLFALAIGGAGFYLLLPTFKSPSASQQPIPKPMAPAPAPLPPLPPPAPVAAGPGTVPPPAVVPATSPTPAPKKQGSSPTAVSSGEKGESTPAVPKTKPAPVPLPKAAPTPQPAKLTPPEPVIMKPDQRVVALLEQLRRSVTERNLTDLDRISIMSDDRRNVMETLFTNYSAIDATIGEIIDTPTGVSTVLQIEKLVLSNGESVPPGRSLRKIRLTVPREGDGWGMIEW